MRILSVRQCLWSIICLTANIILCCPCILAQEQPDSKKFAIQLFASRERIMPYEPLGVAVFVKNDTEQIQKLDRLSWGVSLFYRREGDVDWNGYGMRDNSQFLSGNKTYSLNSGDSVIGYANVCTNYKGSPIFNAPGTFYIKARFGNLETASQKIVVQKPTPKELSVSGDILKGGLFEYFASDEAFSDAYKAEKLDYSRAKIHLQNLVASSSASQYSDWARFSVLLLQEIPAAMPKLSNRDLDVEDRKKLESVKSAYIQLSKKSIYPVNANALYEAGFMSALLEKDVESKIFFNRAINIDKTLRYRVMLLQEELKYFSVKMQPKKPDIDILNEAVRRLEGRGYDVKNFAVYNPSRYREYSKQVLVLSDKKDKKLLSESQYYKQVSALLEGYITKYGRKQAH